MKAFKSYFTPVSTGGGNAAGLSDTRRSVDNAAVELAEKKPSGSSKQASWKPTTSRQTKTTTTTTTTTTTAPVVSSSHDFAQHAAADNTNTITGGTITPVARSASMLSIPDGVHMRPGRRSWRNSDSVTVKSAPGTPGGQDGGSGGGGGGGGGRSGLTSSRHSIFPVGDERNLERDTIHDIRNDMMVNYLYEQLLRKQYASGLDPYEGVVLKKARGSFTCCPPQMCAIPGSLYEVVVQMNVRCALTVNTPVVRTIMDSIRSREGLDEMDYVPLTEDLRVQIVPTMTDLPRGNLHHFAAFIDDVRMLVVWDDEPDKLLARAQDLEMRFMQMIWHGGSGDGDDEDDPNLVPPPPAYYEGKGSKGGWNVNSEEVDPDVLEGGLEERRPIRLWSAGVVSLTLILMIVCLGLGWRSLALETAVDGSYFRFALLAVNPVQILVSLFFFQSLVSSLFQIFGPIYTVESNSKYFSGKPPRRLQRGVHELPHVTIQMPVYKEGLNAVIKPTVVSLKAAISTYEMQGGSANIFVNDDGMQLISDNDAQARRDFYDEHNIGWVARPPHNPRPNEEAGEKKFLRRGKFKKASNMNYALSVANRVEDKLAKINRIGTWNNEREVEAYYQCLGDVLEEDEGRTWADGNIRVGDYILLIDSDTRVPKDCLLDAASEMEQSPDVAIIQFSSGVMNVTDSYFENGVTWFTNLIYSSITFAVASGDSCPFVGHNAVMRWQALQDAAAYTDEDGYEKFWSESHVSEDFDMSLRLQVAGYSLRYAAYTGDGFKEGVSLTVYDELARWEKYAYGCNELLFHPLRFWVTRGPFTPLFRQFIWSGIPLPKKLTICAYIGTYYAIGSVWCMTLANYFITGWFYGLYDKFYLDSFAIYVTIIVVFTALGNFGLAMLRYRLNEKSLISAVFENIRWIPMFTIFLGGISMHVSQAILSHFFEIDMNWGATAKEVEEVHFGEEIWRILRTFKFTFLFCFVCVGLMISGYFFFPIHWRIDKFFSIYPLGAVVVSHFGLPVLLNPALMKFTF